MVTNNDKPLASSAEVHILFNGYVDERVASTVAFVRDGGIRVIIDPGMVPSPAASLEPLAALGESPAAITDVIFSHHHPDHTLNAALFPNARFHDHWAIYKNDIWDSRPAEDPFATDMAALHANRERVLQIATLIVPGHGAPFTPDETTPR